MLNFCGFVYVMVGDGGNIEEVDVVYVDDLGLCFGLGDNVFEYGGVCCFNFIFGFVVGKFCWDWQFDWSVFWESSFGYGVLEVVNFFYVFWIWYWNQDMYKEVVGDQIYIVW